MRASRLVVIVAILSTACSTVLGVPDATTYMVPMRDGVELATDLYLPDGQGPYPTILIRTTYNKDAESKGVRFVAAMAKQYIDNGYAVVAQDTRGRFQSQGVDSVFFTDGVGPLRDGYDTIEWIVSQEWSNGNVGMLGISALGITTYLAAASGHPALKAAHVIMCASNLYDDVFYPGGVYRQRMSDTWVTGQGRADFLPFIRSHASYDSIWQRVDLLRHAGESQAAVYQWGGWFDCMSQGNTRAFTELHERGGNGARGNQMLVMGAWSHHGAGRNQGELRFPENTTDILPNQDALKWFDRHLRGEVTSLDTIPPVRYYLMGDVDDSLAIGNIWMSDVTWPPGNVSTVSYYLNDDGLLSPEQPKSEDSHSVTYEYDPENPVPTLGGLNLYGKAGPVDLSSIESRSDVITFTSAPLSEPVAIAGNVRVRLYAESDCLDTDFMAFLTDVYPDGRSMLILDGAIRARYRDSKESTEFMDPGTVYEFDINLWDTAIVFNRGHRIRMNISSSNAPRFEPNPNTATALGEDTLTVIARNTVHFGIDRPSAIILPVIPLPER